MSQVTEGQEIKSETGLCNDSVGSLALDLLKRRDDLIMNGLFSVKSQRTWRK